MRRHVIKHTHESEAKPLDYPLAWCGRKLPKRDWYYQDAQHVLLTLNEGTAITPCKNCLKAMKRIIDKELSGDFT